MGGGCGFGPHPHGLLRDRVVVVVPLEAIVVVLLPRLGEGSGLLLSHWRKGRYGL